MHLKATANTYVDFQLHSLGWKAFQDLCLTILSDQLGQAVKRFSPVRDGGRDGAFLGDWNPTSSLKLDGETVVQCKYTNRRNASLTLSGFKDEAKKAEILWKRHPRNNYILLSNYRLTAEFEEAERARFAEFGCNNFHVFGYEWIAGAIQESSRLRTLVPRLYGLGDLSQILDERGYLQTTRLLETEGENLRKFVPTSSYRNAVDALDKDGFVLLLGEPAVGKTAIAATLTLASGDMWKCRPMKVERPGELRDHWNPNDPKQFFWIDDAFGAMQYDAGRSHEWNGVLPWLDAALKAGSKVVLTSRDYIYAHARRDLKQGAFPLLRENQVVVDVADLTPEEREQILYNHIRLGDQTKSWKEEFKKFFDLTAKHDRFRPEIARRLGARAFTLNVKLTQSSISDFIENPESFLRESIEGLSDDDRCALAAIFIRGGTLESPVDLTEAELIIIARLGGTSRGITSGLNALNGSFVRSSTIETQSWEFKHPTIGEAFAALIAEDPELVDLYISGAAMDKLLKEITCGSVELQGVKVVVPTTRFDMVIGRLKAFTEPKEVTWQRWRESDIFLAYRCSKEFLQRYIELTPKFWERVLDFGSYLSAESKIDVLARLNECELLSEERRIRCINRIKRLAVQTPDANFLALGAVGGGLLKENDISEIMSHVRDELIPDIDNVLESWADNYSSDEEPDTYFHSLTEAMTTFRDYFGGDSIEGKAFNRAVDRIDGLIEAKFSSYEDEEREERESGIESIAGFNERPIYDDLSASA